MTEHTGERRSHDATGVTLARLEAKIDVALAQHGAKIEAHGQQIGEVRARVQRLEDRPVATPEGLVDHERRLRAVEGRATVSPGQLGAVVIGAAAVAAGLQPFLERIYS